MSKLSSAVVVIAFFASTSCSSGSKFSPEAVFPAGPARTIALMAEENRVPEELPGELRSGLNVIGRYDLTPLLWAVTDDQVAPKTIGTLVRNGADAFYWSKAQRTSAILHSVTYGPVEELAAIASNVPDINQQQGSQPRDEPTILFSAVEVGDVRKVKLLLSAGARLNVRNELGETPLLYARVGQLDVMMALLRAGADPRAKDKRGGGICEVLANVLAPERQEQVAAVRQQLIGEGVNCNAGAR